MEFVLSTESEAPASGYWLTLYKEINPLLQELQTKTYGEELTSIAIISIILRDERFEGGGYPERRYFSHKRKEADIRLRIDFNQFIRARPDERRRMYTLHILESIMQLRTRVSKEYRFDELISDVSNLLT